MISRQTTQALANLLEHLFSRLGHPGRFCDPTRFYDFLFANNYPAYFMNLVQRLDKYDSSRKLTELISRLHTGETLHSATPEWDQLVREKLGNKYLVDLAEDALQFLEVRNPDIAWIYTMEDRKPLRSRLVSRLELDGYIFQDGRLLFSEATVLDTEEEEGVLQRLMKEMKLPDLATPQHHLVQTGEHYAAGRWDDCISNARKVLESVLSQSALVHSTHRGSPLSADKLSRPVEVREYLERQNLLEAKEKKALAEVYGLLSNTGGHPYIAEKDQARLMRHLALTFTQFVLLRLQGSLQTMAAAIP